MAAAPPAASATARIPDSAGQRNRLMLPTPRPRAYRRPPSAPTPTPYPSRVKRANRVVRTELIFIWHSALLAPNARMRVLAVKESSQHLSSEVLHEQEAPDGGAWVLAGGQRRPLERGGGDRGRCERQDWRAVVPSRWRRGPITSPRPNHRPLPQPCRARGDPCRR